MTYVVKPDTPCSTSGIGSALAGPILIFPTCGFEPVRAQVAGEQAELTNCLRASESEPCGCAAAVELTMLPKCKTPCQKGFSFSLTSPPRALDRQESLSSSGFCGGLLFLFF